MGGDADLVKRGLSGDRSAIELLVQRHVGPVRAGIIAVLGHHSEVDDLTQETLLRGLRDLASLREPARVGAWLRGIARHLCHDVLRRKYRRPLSLDEGDAEPAAPIEEDGPDLTPVRSAVLGLPEKLREAILLFYVDRASYDEIAARLDITPAAVNRRLTRARNLLRERLSPHEKTER